MLYLNIAGIIEGVHKLEEEEKKEENFVFCLHNSSWVRGTVIKETPKTYKISVQGTTKTFLKKKCAKPEEKICLVLEKWTPKKKKFKVRVERVLYSDRHVEAEYVLRERKVSVVREKEKGIIIDGSNK